MTTFAMRQVKAGKGIEDAIDEAVEMDTGGSSGKKPTAKAAAEPDAIDQIVDLFKKLRNK